MYKGRKFRLITPAVGVTSKDGNRVPITIPKNAIVEVTTGQLNYERMMEFQWERTNVMLFPQDVRERSIPVKQSH